MAAMIQITWSLCTSNARRTNKERVHFLASDHTFRKNLNLVKTLTYVAKNFKIFLISHKKLVGGGGGLGKSRHKKLMWEGGGHLGPTHSAGPAMTKFVSLNTIKTSWTINYHTKQEYLAMYFYYFWLFTAISLPKYVSTLRWRPFFFLLYHGGHIWIVTLPWDNPSSGFCPTHFTVTRAKFPVVLLGSCL